MFDFHSKNDRILYHRMRTSSKMKPAKREAAKERQKIYDSLSKEQKLSLLLLRRGESRKEKAKILNT